MLWFRADDHLGPIGLQKTLALPAEYWLQFDIYIPASTLHACDDGDLLGETATLMQLGSDGAEQLYGEDFNYLATVAAPSTSLIGSG